MRLLDSIHNRDALCALTDTELSEYCSELRNFLISHVSDCGGHLASNLGIVEAMVAIHRVFDTAHDRLVFDVGHQCYVHKIITGRMAGFTNLRQFGGLSGFPKPEESVHDAFVAGHASNSVSVALGMARARTLKGEQHHVIALIGDGALTGGLSYEGLNDAGASGEPMIVLLNDNGMSIGKNVGAISRHLAKLRLKPQYFGFKKSYRRVMRKIPGGDALYRLTHSVKLFFKRSLIGRTVFEDMGFTYLGPVDGHNINKVSYLLRVAKEMGTPTVLHIVTQKGRGYSPAEKDPTDYHGVGHFDPSIGLCGCSSSRSYSRVFGETICRIAAANDKVCAVSAAMPLGTGLSTFAENYPNRFFDVGIAEGHAVSMTGGLAAGGMIPVVAIYSTFLQRAFDMMIHDVALMRQHVVFAIDRAGLVGEDGPTHHGVFDVGFVRMIPSMTVISPTTASELEDALHYAVEQCSGPIAVRYPRGSAPDSMPLQRLSDRASVLLICYGEMSATVFAAAEALNNAGISASVLRLVVIKPLDLQSIRSAANGTKAVIVIEDCQAIGSVGQEIAAGLSDANTVYCMNLKDQFTPHGSISSLYDHIGLNDSAIVRYAREVLSIET